jgi:hypothetical protein
VIPRQDRVCILHFAKDFWEAKKDHVEIAADADPTIYSVQGISAQEKKYDEFVNVGLKLNYFNLSISHF